MQTYEPDPSIARLPGVWATQDAAERAAQALRNGPTGAFAVASIAVGLLLIGWLAFYFLLFMPRGAGG